MRVNGLPDLDRDIRAMDQWYPQFALIRIPPGQPHWSGAIKPFRSRLQLFRLAVVYRDSLVGVPRIWVLSPEISRRTHSFHPHLNADGSVCAFFAPDCTYDPGIHDVSVLVDLAGDWLRKHIFYEEFGWWPGPVAPHDPDDVLAELKSQPSKPCVCGSGSSFDRCCWARYRHLANLLAARRITPAARIIDELEVTRLTRANRRRLGPYRMAELLPCAGPPVDLLGRAQGDGANELFGDRHHTRTAPAGSARRHNVGEG